MDYTVAMLVSLLQLLTVGTAAPLSVEVDKMKRDVRWRAELLLVRLDNFQVPGLSPTTDDLDGTSSIVMVLEGYNSLISDTLTGVSQIKADISSLAGFLDQWRQGHCSADWPKPSVPGSLQQLQSSKGFIHTVSREALMRVKDFLNLLLQNLDQLEIC